MDFIFGNMRPGKVRDVLENGQIKVVAPGLFSITDDLELLPPIMPWFIGSNSNAYSQPVVGDEVWILNFTNNPLQLFWFKKEYVGEQWDNIEADENIEIVCNRKSKNGWATIYFSDGSGWVIGNGETKLVLNSDGSIQFGINKDNRNIHINADNISIGSIGTSSHPAAYGDKVEDILSSLCSLLSNVATKALGNPHTIMIGQELMTGLSKVTNKISEISSEHVTID